MPVDLENGQHRDERGPLVAVDERLRLRDPVRENGCLQREISLLIVPFGAAACAGPTAAASFGPTCRRVIGLW